MFLETLLGLAMAMAMHSAFKGQGILRTVVLVPWAVLTVVTAIMWKTIFDPNLGFVNQMLGTKTVWLGEEPQALMVMIFADVWKTAPFMALLLLAGLQVIPSEIYEAANVDGATAWQRFRKITLPLLMPALLVALIFRTLDALRAFDLPKVLTNGANGTRRSRCRRSRTFQENRLYGEGSALSILTFIIVMAVSFAYIRLVGGNIRGMTEEWPWQLLPSPRPRCRKPAEEAQAAARPGEDPVVAVDRRRRDRPLLPAPVLLADQHLAQDRSRPLDGDIFPPSPSLDNYKSIFENSDFTRSLANSAIVALVTTFLGIVVGAFAPTRSRG